MSRSRVTQLPVVLGATVRTVPAAVIVIALLAAIPALIVAAHGGNDFAGALSAASLIAGAGAGFAADDPAAPTLASSPTTLAVRRGLRGLLIALILGAGWSAAVVTAHRYGANLPDAAVPLAELSATAAVAAAFGSRARTDTPVNTGAAAATVAFLAIVTISALANRWPTLPTLRATPTHDRWWLVAVAGVAVAGWSSRDPASRLGPRVHRT